MKLFEADWSARWAELSPHRPAVKDLGYGQSLTYAELHRQGETLARHLHARLGLRKGDRIAVLAPLGLDYVRLFVAAQKTGIILVPLNYRLSPRELQFQLQDTHPSLLLVAGEYESLLPQGHGMPTHALQQVASWSSPPPDGSPLPDPQLVDTDPVFILYTSGTTGHPKGARYTHGMLFWNSLNTGLSLGLTPDSRTVNCMPPFHTGGWNVLLTPLLHHGGYTCLVPGFDPEQLLPLLEEETPTLFMAIPTMLKMLTSSPKFEATRLDSLDYLIVGGEPMPIPLIETWHARGIAIRQGYGLTEVGPNLTSLHQRDAIRKKGSIGFPNFYVQTRIVDEGGKEVAAGEAGELQLKGPMVTPGYWNRPEATKAAFEDGWFKTGDRVRRDEEGYLYVVDRIKHMFISGGENVYPAEVERVLCAHPDIEAAVVVGIPHPTWGEVGKAFLVGEPLAPELLQAHCREHLAKFKVPKEFVFIDALPTNATGKVDRKALG